MNFDKCYTDLLNYQFVVGSIEDIEELPFPIAG